MIYLLIGLYILDYILVVIIMKTPQSLMSAMNATQPKTSLFDMIYSFPTKIE